MDWKHSILVQSLLFFHLNKLEPLVAFLVDIEHLLSGGWHVEYLCLGILVVLYYLIKFMVIAVLVVAAVLMLVMNLRVRPILW